MKEKHINTQMLFVHVDVLHPEHTGIQPCSITHPPLQHTAPPMSWVVAGGGAGLTYKPCSPKDVTDGPTRPVSIQEGPCPPVPASLSLLYTAQAERDPAGFQQLQGQAGDAQAEEQQQSSEPSIISKPAQSKNLRDNHLAG